MGRLTFRDELINLINSHSKENGSDTPDHILGTYLVQCLAAFDTCVNAREIWYGRESTKPINIDVPVERLNV